MLLESVHQSLSKPPRAANFLHRDPHGRHRIAPPSVTPRRSKFSPGSIRASLATLVLACLVAAPAGATIYTVGAGADCTHKSLLDALAAAVADNSPGPHEIRIARTEIVLAAQDYVISNPVRDIQISGGHANCSTPTQAGRTILTRTGSGRRVLEVTNAVANPRRVVTLSRLTLRGGDISSGQGGGLWIVGRASVHAANETFINGNRAPNGGGVAMLNLSADPEIGPTMLLSNRSQICENRATGAGSNGNGGGVYMLGGSRLTLWDARICNNEARRHGGGLYLDGVGNQLRLDPWSNDRIEIDGNVAGDDVFSATTGFGGAIYVGPNASVAYNSAQTPATQLSLSLSLNRANFGGALYAAGETASAGPFTLIELRNPVMANNDALGRGGAVMLRNAVDLRLVPFGSGRCRYFGFETPCVWGVANRAVNTSFPTNFGGGGFAFLEHDSGAPRPALRVAGALFFDNRDLNGTAAVIDARGDSSVRVLRSVFEGNSAGGWADARALIESRADVLFAFNTVLGNSVNRMIWVESGSTEVNVTGSILYAPGVLPFVGPSGALVHNGCLISHTASGLPPGVTVAAPRISSEGYAPNGGSPAIDACNQGVGDVFWAAGWDAYAQSAPVNVPSIPNVGGPWDMGAVEQRDIILYSGFGQRPTN